MDFGPRPKDRPQGTGTTPRSVRHAPLTARQTRRHALKSCWTRADFGSLSSNELVLRYPTALNFYDEPPRCEINLETLETLAVERLRFLRVIEKHSSSSKYTSDWVQNIKDDLRSQGLAAYINLDEEKYLSNRARDHFSHFILRLAYCRTDDLRRWFVSQEVDAFRWRCLTFGHDHMSDFMHNYDLAFTEIDEEEKTRLEKELLSATLNSSIGGKTFYKVHFSEALDLVRSRRVFLQDGFCYVPDTDLKSLLMHMFKSLLTQNVALTAKTLPNLDEDDRLVKMLADLDKRYTGDDYGSANSSAHIRPEQIKPLNDKGAFPLCMRSMQSALDKTHHLKYKARLQYGLFLKGIGLSLEDALSFFRGEFTQSHVDADKFDKEYAYGIRYNYGKEGKKVNWAPYNCMRIIMESVGPGENHGCPYRHHDPESLRSLLVASGVQGEELQNIVQASKEGHYQKACSMQFKAAHKGQELSTGGITEHPNQYYQESVNGGATKSSLNSARANLKTERASMYVNNSQ